LIKNRVDKQLLLSMEMKTLIALNIGVLDAQRLVNWQKQIMLQAERPKQEKQVEVEWFMQADEERLTDFNLQFGK